MTTFAIGVDLGGTNLRIAAITPDGQRLDTIALPTRLAAGPQAVLDDMTAAIQGLIQSHGGNRRLLGVGVGSPGPLELPAGVLHHPPNLPGFDGLALRAELECRLRRPVQVDSDGNLAAYGEFVLGAGRTCAASSLLMLTLGTGVGGGIILDGCIWHGMKGAAGECGHLPIDPAGPACNCGAHGCLETYASATSIVRRARELGLEERHSGGNGSSPPLTASSVATLAKSGEPAALRVFDEMGRALGLSLAHLINAFDLPLYVIGGGAAAAWSLFAPRMFETVREMSYVYRMSMPADPSCYQPGMTHIVPAELGSDAGLLGAALLPVGCRTTATV